MNLKPIPQTISQVYNYIGEENTIKVQGIIAWLSSFMSSREDTKSVCEEVARAPYDLKASALYNVIKNSNVDVFYPYEGGRCPVQLGVRILEPQEKYVYCAISRINFDKEGTDYAPLPTWAEEFQDKMFRFRSSNLDRKTVLEVLYPFVAAEQSIVESHIA